MTTEQEIITEIEKVVDKYGPGRYGMWIIGTTADPESVRKGRSPDLCQCWNADSPEDAGRIMEIFTSKGMCPASDSKPGRFLYLY